MSEDCNTTSCSEPRSLTKKPRILRGSQQTANHNSMAMAISKFVSLPFYALDLSVHQSFSQRLLEFELQTYYRVENGQRGERHCA